MIHSKYLSGEKKPEFISKANLKEIYCTRVIIQAYRDYLQSSPIIISEHFCAVQCNTFGKNDTYFLLVFGLSLFAVLGRPDFFPDLLDFGFIASSAPSAVYAR